MKRIALQFDRCVYAGESKLWFVIDHEATPTIQDVLLSLTNKLNLDFSLSKIYVNGIVAPNWVSSEVICSTDDMVTVTKSPSEASEHQPQNSVLFSNSVLSVSENLIINKIIKTNLKNLPSDGNSIIVADPSIEEKVNNSVPFNNTCAEESMQVEVNETLDTSKDDPQNPYLASTSLKINNNFKRPKLPNTTPTHNDKYTNRSKIYVSPGNAKKSQRRSIPSALQAAVRETVEYSSKPSPSLKRALDKTREHDAKLSSSVVADSINKSKLFQDRVSSLISNKAAAKKTESSSEDSSMTSTSSDDEGPQQQPSKIQKTAKKEETSSDDSDSDDDKSKPTISTLPKKHSSSETNLSSLEKKAKTSSSALPASGPIIRNPQPSSTDDSDDDVVKPAIKDKTPAAIILAKKDRKKEESDEDSSDESDESDDDVKPAETKANKKSSDVDCSKTTVATSYVNKNRKREDSTSSEESEKENTGNRKINNNIAEESSDESCDSAKDDPIKAAEKAKKDYSVYVALQGAPRVSDKLAFKMLDLNQSYCPVVSDYKEGVITEYNPSSQLITVKLLPPFVTLHQRDGRFELDGAEEAMDLIELNLKQLIEPKLLSSEVN